MSGTTKIKLSGEFGSRTVFIDGKVLSPEQSYKWVNHSPDGFAWGYGGSGPSQLALAVLLHMTTPEKALSKYQDFKWDVIAVLPQSNFEQEVDMTKYI